MLCPIFYIHIATNILSKNKSFKNDFPCDKPITIHYNFQYIFLNNNKRNYNNLFKHKK
jgi:hypothetical protein